MRLGGQGLRIRVSRFAAGGSRLCSILDSFEEGRWSFCRSAESVLLSFDLFIR